MTKPRIIDTDPMALARDVAELYELHDSQTEIVEMLLESVRILNNRVVELEKRNGPANHE